VRLLLRKMRRSCAGDSCELRLGVKPDFKTSGMSEARPLQDGTSRRWNQEAREKAHGPGCEEQEGSGLACWQGMGQVTGL
jgi:hypothetical protein